VTALETDGVNRLSEMLGSLSCALLRDAAPSYTRVVQSSVRCRTPGRSAAGPVFPVSTANDMLPCLQALHEAPAGSVIVLCNTAAESEALAGDIFVTACKQRGLGGLVVQGAVRDVDALQDLDFPVFSSQVTYQSAKTAKVPAARVPQTVTIGSCTLEPGEWLIADGDGMLAIPGKYVSAIARAAILLNQREEELKTRLRGGETLGDLCGLDDFLAGRAPLRFEV
jgi:4-hydroxy-4-methyl-2-oxoglutarate aldolase